ncbi:hypothetical protein PAHAL_3G384400 [Panicum hallii]|uniref:Uncharacterized protein n=1 Tax=Panicum hallii TaxID=206008 RepID=A0A2T8KKT4_9POAL|nr:hypothetical protein PAHAL_3G384400 [Panicum hallii]
MPFNICILSLPPHLSPASWRTQACTAPATWPWACPSPRGPWSRGPEPGECRPPEFCPAPAVDCRIKSPARSSSGGSERSSSTRTLSKSERPEHDSDQLHGGGSTGFAAEAETGASGAPIIARRRRRQRSEQWNDPSLAPGISGVRAGAQEGGSGTPTSGGRRRTWADAPRHDLPCAASSLEGIRGRKGERGRADKWVPHVRSMSSPSQCVTRTV